MLATIMEAQLSSILSSEREFHRSESGLIACSLRSVTSSGSSSIYSSSFHSASLFRYRISIIGFLELVEVVLHLVVKLVCKVVIGDLVAAEGQIEMTNSPCSLSRWFQILTPPHIAEDSMSDGM
jgi:hypothetical protein